MARHKPHIDAREEIAKASWVLFCEKGYEATSVAEVLEIAGLSKGTFYHYFKSKEELLDAVTEHAAQVAVAAVRGVSAAGPGRGAIQRLNRFFTASRNWRVANAGFMRELLQVLYRDENTIIRHKMNRRNIALSTPVLAEILSAGQEEGVFDIADPIQTAELLLNLFTSMSESQAELLLGLEKNPQNLELIKSRIEHLLSAVERILGLAPQTLNRPPSELVDQIARKMTERR